MASLFQSSLIIGLPLVMAAALGFLVASTFWDEWNVVLSLGVVSAALLILPFVVSAAMLETSWALADGISVSGRGNVPGEVVVQLLVLLVALLAIAALLTYVKGNRRERTKLRSVRSVTVFAGAIVVIFGFGRYVGLHAPDLNGTAIDLLLGIGGTWLVTKVVMPWAMEEFDGALVKPPPIVVARVIVVLFTALIVVTTIVFGIRAMILSEQGSFALETGGFQPGHFVPAGWLMLGGLGYFKQVARRVGSADLLLALVMGWALGGAIIWWWLSDWGWIRAVWAGWFAVMSAGFLAEGYFRNSTIVFGLPVRWSTRALTCELAVACFISINLTMLTASWELTIGIVTCVALVFGLTGLVRFCLATEFQLEPTGIPALERSAFGAVTQDAGTSGVLAVFFGFVPLIVAGVAGWSLTLLSFIVFYAGFVAIGMGFLVHADVKFLEKCQNDGYISSDTPVEKRPNSLAGYYDHISFHVHWTMLALAPITILQWIELPIEQLLRKGNVSTNVWETRSSLEDRAPDHSANRNDSTPVADRP